MKKLAFLTLIVLLTGCGVRNSCCGDLCDLKTRLSSATEELTIAQNRVSRLEEKVALREIGRIKREIMTRSVQLPLAYLAIQREILMRIIHEQPTFACEAQDVLDEILVYITDSALENSI